MFTSASFAPACCAIKTNWFPRSSCKSISASRSRFCCSIVAVLASASALLYSCSACTRRCASSRSASTCRRVSSDCPTPALCAAAMMLLARSCAWRISRSRNAFTCSAFAVWSAMYASDMRLISSSAAASASTCLSSADANTPASACACFCASFDVSSPALSYSRRNWSKCRRTASNSFSSPSSRSFSSVRRREISFARLSNAISVADLPTCTASPVCLAFTPSGFSCLASSTLMSLSAAFLASVYACPTDLPASLALTSCRFNSAISSRKRSFVSDLIESARSISFATIFADRTSPSKYCTTFVTACCAAARNPAKVAGTLSQRSLNAPTAANSCRKIAPITGISCAFFTNSATLSPAC